RKEHEEDEIGIELRRRDSRRQTKRESRYELKDRRWDRQPSRKRRQRHDERGKGDSENDRRKGRHAGCGGCRVSKTTTLPPRRMNGVRSRPCRQDLNSELSRRPR